MHQHQSSKSHPSSKIAASKQQPGTPQLMFAKPTSEDLKLRQTRQLMHNSSQLTQLKAFNDRANSSNRIQQIAQLQAKASQNNANPLHLKTTLSESNAVVQRYVGPYKHGRTLAVTTKAMRGLTDDQMDIVQDLHDDEDNNYTVDEARKIAIERTTKGKATATPSNPYDWDVTGLGSFTVPDKGIQDVLNTFGHPTTDVVKKYEDLANRVRFDVGKSGKGSLKPMTIFDLNRSFEASKPLHLGANPFLNAAWKGKLNSYTGSKTGIPLYSHMRSQYTKKFKSEKVATLSLNDILKGVSSKPFELHHIKFKKHYPKLAADQRNLMLTERSKKESVEGPGQHELMHKVASGNSSDKFNVLLPQYVQTYDDWVKSQIKK